MSKKLIRLITIAAALIIIAGLAYAIYYFILSDPRTAPVYRQNPDSLFSQGS